ncbi:MAG: hypothetical protein ACYC1L_13480 [Alphaproteobacteria bacterium]
MIDRRRHALRNAARALSAFALVFSAAAASGPAWADSANPLSENPIQPIEPLPSGPIVGGSKLQPRADQVSPGASTRLADDPKLKELYEGVMRDSDPSTYRRNREPVAR